MNKNLKTLIAELGLSINEEKILAFLDGNLSNDDSNKINSIIEKNPHLKLKTDELRHIIDNPILESPPKNIHSKLMKKLGINEDTIFDICLKSLQNGIDIISGKNLLINNNRGIPVFRSENQSELYFEKQMKDINIICIFNHYNEEELSIHFKIKTNNGASNKNIQIKLFKNDILEKSLITDSFGATKSFRINNGDYTLSVLKNKVLGTVHLKLLK